MARTPAVAGGRPVVITVRLSKSEAEAFDRARRGLSRSEAGRVAVNRFSSTPPQHPSALKIDPPIPTEYRPDLL